MTLDCDCLTCAAFKAGLAAGRCLQLDEALATTWTLEELRKQYTVLWDRYTDQVKKTEELRNRLDVASNDMRKLYDIVSTLTREISNIRAGGMPPIPRRNPGPGDPGFGGPSSDW